MKKETILDKKSRGWELKGKENKEQGKRGPKKMVQARERTENRTGQGYMSVKKQNRRILS